MVTTVTDNSPQSINTSLFAMDSEIQKVKKIAESFDEKLSGIDIETGVLSVNGKQGVVELTASDVDALPSSTVIPTTTSELENTSGFITSSDSITGNAATATTADKVKNALTVNGKTYDGSSAIDAGVQTIANGGTGQTTQADINKAFVGGLDEGPSDVTDGTMFVSSYASDNGFADTNAANVPYKRKFSRVWEYIKGKISSVLGLTASNYGGNAATAGTADSAKLLSYKHGNEINFKGGAVSSCYFNYRNADTDGSSPVDTMMYLFCNYSVDTSKSVIKAGIFDGTTAKASNKLVIPIGAPSSLEDGCIWIS